MIATHIKVRTHWLFFVDIDVRQVSLANHYFYLLQIGLIFFQQSVLEYLLLEPSGLYRRLRVGYTW
jgi:hypothetical protein